MPQTHILLTLTETPKKVLKYALFISVAAVLAYLAFKGHDWGEIMDVMLNADFFWVGVSMFIGFVAFVSRGLRWLILLEPHGYKPNVFNCIYAVFLSYLANFMAPRFGEVARCTALNRSDKVPFDVAFGTVVLERVIDLLLLLVFMVTAALVSMDKFGKFFLEIFGKKANEMGASGMSNYLLLASLLGVAGLVVLILLRKRLNQIAVFQKVGKFIKGMLDGLSSIWKMEQKWMFLLHTFIIWGCYWGMTYTAFFALAETSHLEPFDGIYVLVLGGLGMAAPAQGGIGAYHYIVSKGLAVYGISEAVGLGFATLVHGSQTITVIIFGGLSLILLILSNRKNAANELSQNASAKSTDS